MPDWSQLSIGVAAVALVFYVVREFRRLLHETLTFFGNHMSAHTEQQAKVAESLNSVAESLRTLTREAQEAHRQAAEAHAPKPRRSRVAVVKE